MSRPLLSISESLAKYLCNPFALCVDDVVRGKPCSVCQNHDTLDCVHPFQVSCDGDIAAAVLSGAGLELCDRDFRLLVQDLLQYALLSIRHRLPVLVSFDLPAGQPCRLRSGRAVAGQGGEGRENRRPVTDGHPRVSGGGCISLLKAGCRS